MIENLNVRVHQITYEAQGIQSFDLRLPDGGALPPFTAGAHITVHLGNGQSRDYSLVNSQDERHRYVIAAALDTKGSAGTRWLFDTPLVGKTLRISAPRNNFELDETAAHTVLIAGGIGITPLRAMIHRLEALGRDWRLYYGARDRASMAFRAELAALDAPRPGRVQLNFDDEAGHLLDLALAVALAPQDAHLYCCGPSPMLETFKQLVCHRDPATVHLEYFAAPAESDRAPTGSFTVTLARTGRTIPVPAGRTILDVLRENGVFADYSCEAGVCGACEVRVLSGRPDHRDYMLTEDERAANTSMMICVSGSLTENLTIDL